MGSQKAIHAPVQQRRGKADCGMGKYNLASCILNIRLIFRIYKEFKIFKDQENKKPDVLKKK